ncbi:PTPA-CTERM sorting domain-containing protein [Nodosilinea nodulosa]|uniref:PTPA-CTERM sorting domain-containing protein n=1 Tax=Nodosilinea nodulosa TaxID=416001 RepID=UPI00037ED87F|nr:PTPA-CTERM sorting domain-containing protein [Nodosilinea nodulosa]
MSIFPPKNVAIAAAVVLATVSVTNAKPAHAFTFTQTADFLSTAGGNPVEVFDGFAGLQPAGPNINIRINPGNDNLRLRNGASTAVFDFSSSPVAYFGIKLATSISSSESVLFTVLDQLGNSSQFTFQGLINNNTVLNVLPQNAIEKISSVTISKDFSGGIAFKEYATAVPTPALLPGLVGLGIAALRKKQGDLAEDEQA